MPLPSSRPQTAQSLYEMCIRDRLLRYLCENSVGLEQWLEVLADVGQSYELLENAGTAGMIPDFAGDNLDFCTICRF